MTSNQAQDLNAVGLAIQGDPIAVDRVIQAGQTKVGLGLQAEVEAEETEGDGEMLVQEGAPVGIEGVEGSNIISTMYLSLPKMRKNEKRQFIQAQSPWP